MSTEETDPGLLATSPRGPRACLFPVNSALKSGVLGFPSRGGLTPRAQTNEPSAQVEAEQVAATNEPPSQVIITQVEAPQVEAPQVLQPAETEFRLWTDHNGKKIKARWIATDDDSEHITLETPTGKNINAVLRKFSAEDRAYIQSKLDANR